MSARRRYHGPNRWDRRSGDNVRRAVRTLAQALGVGVCRHDWRDASWQRRQRGRWVRMSEPRWFASARPRRPFPRVPEPPRGRPFVNGYEARGWNWQRIPGRPDPLDWRDMVLPRRGQAVAVIEAPRCPGQKVLRERQPRGLIPRGTPRGGPERSAEEPWRKPRGGLCGGPERSAKDPQTPKKAAQPKANGKREARKEVGKKPKSPTIITVEMNGRERSWGPSRRPMPGELAAFCRT